MASASRGVAAAVVSGLRAGRRVRVEWRDADGGPCAVDAVLQTVTGGELVLRLGEAARPNAVVAGMEITLLAGRRDAAVAMAVRVIGLRTGRAAQVLLVTTGPLWTHTTMQRRFFRVDTAIPFVSARGAGTIANLSPGGCLAVWGSGDPPQPGERIAVTLHLPGSDAGPLTLRAVAARVHGAPDHVAVGLTFTAPTARQRRALDGFVIQRQREVLRFGLPPI